MRELLKSDTELSEEVKDDMTFLEQNVYYAKIQKSVLQLIHKALLQ